MLRGFEGDQRIVQALRLPVGPGLAPVGGMSGDAVDELVVSEILRALVGVAAARARASGSGSAGSCGRWACPIRSCSRSGWWRRTRRSCRSGRSTDATALRTSSARRWAARWCRCPSCRSPCWFEAVKGNVAFRLDSWVFQSMTFAESPRAFRHRPPKAGWSARILEPAVSRETSTATRTGPFSTTRICAGPPT